MGVVEEFRKPDFPSFTNSELQSVQSAPAAFAEMLNCHPCVRRLCAFRHSCFYANEPKIDGSQLNCRKS